MTGTIRLLATPSVLAAGPNPDNVAVFGAERSKDGALTIMIVNKYLTGNTPLVVNLTNYTGAGTAQVWQLNSSDVITQLSNLAYTRESFKSRCRPKHHIICHSAQYRPEFAGRAAPHRRTIPILGQGRNRRDFCAAIVHQSFHLDACQHQYFWQFAISVPFARSGAGNSIAPCRRRLDRTGRFKVLFSWQFGCTKMPEAINATEHPAVNQIRKWGGQHVPSRHRRPGRQHAAKITVEGAGPGALHALLQDEFQASLSPVQRLPAFVGAHHPPRAWRRNAFGAQRASAISANRHRFDAVFNAFHTWHAQ